MIDTDVLLLQRLALVSRDQHETMAAADRTRARVTELAEARRRIVAQLRQRGVPVTRIARHLRVTKATVYKMRVGAR